MVRKKPNLHIGFEKRYGRIFLGEGEAIPGCDIEWKSKSDDRTDEVMRVVAARFKFLLDRENESREVKKPYVCCELPGVGKKLKLVYIEGNYDFDIKPGIKKKTRGRKKQMK